MRGYDKYFVNRRAMNGFPTTNGDKKLAHKGDCERVRVRLEIGIYCICSICENIITVSISCLKSPRVMSSFAPMPPS